MKYLKIFVVAALCLSLFINFSSLSKIDNLENKVNTLLNDQSQLLSRVNSQTTNIRNTMNEIKREQSWISPISANTTITDIDQGNALVTFQWQIKELNDNSKVVFNYKNGDQEEYTSIEAVEKASGLFEAVVPIEVTLEPEWRIIGSSMDARAERAIEEDKRANMKDNSLAFNYFVTVAHNDLVKSSAINSNRFNSLGVQHYGYIETHINNSNNHSRVSVIGYPSHDVSSPNLEEVYLKKYKDEQLLDEEKLVLENDIHEAGMPIRENGLAFHTKPSDEKLDYSRLVLRVVYSDGASFEKEIDVNSLQE